MDKQQFIQVLQSALLNWDGIAEQELGKDYGLNPQLVRVGVQLCSYLKPKEVLVYIVALECLN